MGCHDDEDERKKMEIFRIFQDQASSSLNTLRIGHIKKSDSCGDKD